jgi:pSer/pThr/pTyr-binding forkhead associated (FHA) protein
VSTWLNAWRNRESRDTAQPVIELMVLAGEDAGSQFTIEGDRVLLGRGRPESGVTDVVRLEDKSISRRQAWIERSPAGTTIEHIASASNPTLVNGVPIDRSPLGVGDRIEMGRVVIGVRARGGTNLRGLTEIMEDAARESTATGAGPRDASSTRQETTESGVRVSEQTTDVRPMQVAFGELRIVRGATDPASARFPLHMGTLRIGRSDDADVQITELGVSRLHAELVVDGRGIRLAPMSRTNPTLVNGMPVQGTVELGDGDEIQLADRVVLALALSSTASSAAMSRAREERSGLSHRMERKLDLEREIERYSVMGSFLDVDVVASREMKRHGAKAEHIIVSFERFRAYVSGICDDFSGQVLNSNGDELMCFFETATDAVRAGLAILADLPRFNREANLLDRDFRFRLGAHTGVSLVDLNAGIAYSEVLDTAGHIQKLAEPDTLVVSQTTFDSLPDGIQATRIAELTGAGCLYRIEAWTG